MVSMDESKIKSCLHLARKLPVSKYKKSIEAITNLIYEDDELLNEFLQKIDQPAEICLEDKKGEFLTCEYNRDGDFYRSNNSNEYFPKPEEGEELRYPSKDMREFEILLNKIFKEYTKLYYGTSSVCSCFAWNLGEKTIDGICVAVVIKNKVDGEKGIAGGCWDSSNLVQINFKKHGDEIEAKYTLTTTVFFTASLTNTNAGTIGFSGSTTKLVSNCIY